jgi:hypothetical protein
MNHVSASGHDPRQDTEPGKPPPADPSGDKPHPEYRLDIYRDWCKSCGICASGERKVTGNLIQGRARLLQGNEAVEGALAAGCRFFAGYPITPATEISEVSAYRLPAEGGVPWRPTSWPWGL